MGFLVDKNCPGKVVKEACTLDEKSKVTRKAYKKKYHKKCESYKGEYLMFIDIETDGILGELGEYDYIPNIKQLACIMFKTKDYFEKDYISDFSLWYEYKDLHIHSEYIVNFMQIYTYYGYPCIIAHNGCAFDFKILISHINRYIPKSALELNYFRTFDTYIAIQQMMLKKRKHKNDGRISLKNVSLFMKYCPNNYEKYSYLAALAHQALPDCKMTCLWVHVLRHQFNWAQYNGYLDI